MGGRSVIRFTRRDELHLVDGVASLLDGGLEVVDAYRTLAADRPSYAGRVRVAAGAVAGGLERGLGLREAVASSVVRLDPVHAAMLHVADATGDARTAFDSARRFLAAQKRLHDETTGALLYPALVAGLALVGSIALVVFVIPAAQRLLAPLAGPDASVTALLARGRRAVTGVFAVLATAAVAAGVLLGSRGRGRPVPWADRLRMHIPLLGPYELTADLFACTTALAGTTRVGMPLVEALEIAASCCGNSVVSGRLLSAATAVAQGAHAGEELARAVVGVPEASYSFLLCGSGSDIADTAAAVAERLASRLERATRRLGSIMEPALIVVAGIAIVALVVSLVAPLFRLYGEVLP